MPSARVDRLVGGAASELLREVRGPAEGRDGQRTSATVTVVIWRVKMFNLSRFPPIAGRPHRGCGIRIAMAPPQPASLRVRWPRRGSAAGDCLLGGGRGYLGKGAGAHLARHAPRAATWGRLRERLRAGKATRSLSTGAHADPEHHRCRVAGWSLTDVRLAAIGRHGRAPGLGVALGRVY